MGHRLLIVDSDQAFLKMHRVALDSAFDVDLLPGTEGALQRLEAGDHAAVLICVEASENKGYALCSGLRKHPLLQGLKIALISAKATEEEYARHQSLRGRADVYLHKPILSSALVGALSPLLPARPVDPDNPLGDLSGVDLGEEWLKGLEAELDVTPVSPQDIFGSPAEPPIMAQAEAAPQVELHLKPETISLPILDLEPLPEESMALELEVLSEMEEPPAPTLQTVAIQVPQALRSAPNAGMVELLEARIQDLEAKLVEGAHALKAKAEDAEALEQRLEKADRATESLRDQLEEVEARSATLHGVEVDVVELRAATEDLRARLAEATEARQLAEGRLAEVELERDGAQQKATELEGRATQAEGSLETFRAAAGAGSSQMEELERELELSRQDVTGLEATLRAQRRELAEQGTHLNSLILQKANLEARQMELEAIAARLADAENEAASLREHGGLLEAQILELQEEREGLVAFRVEAEAHRARLAELEPQLTELQAERNRLAPFEVEAESHRARLSELEPQLLGLQVERDRLAPFEAEAESHRTHLSELEAQLLELRSERDRLLEFRTEAEAHRARLSELEPRMADLQETYERLGAALQRSEAEGEACLTRAREIEEKLAFAERERDEVRHIADELRGACEAEHQRARSLEDELKAVREDHEQRSGQTAAAHQKEILELLGGIDEREAQMLRLNQTLNAQRERLENQEREKARLEADFRDAAQQLREREDAAVNLEQERRRLEGDLSERTARLDALTQAIGDLEQGIRRATDLTRPF